MPNTVGALMAIRARKHQHKFERGKGLVELSNRLKKNLGKEVLQGPFEGLKLTNSSFDTHVGPILLGTYKKEIHKGIKKSISRKHENVINIGSKLGYYAVGLAMKKPESRVYAFEIDPWGRKMTKKLKDRNDIKNVRVRWACKPKTLKKFSSSRNLIISDCEGYEQVIFGEMGGSDLARSDLIIEVHPPGSKDSLRYLKEIFLDTHNIEVVRYGEKERGYDGVIPSNIAQKAVKEYRGNGQEWLMCWSKRYEDNC
jgi:tRNA G37 N-methylase Trm5